MPGRPRTIYVQIDISAPVERVWQLTQTPDLHQRWDLRFTRIDYLPRPDPEQPQRFLYATRIGFGLTIHGQGESAGTRDGPGGLQTSALKFWSDDPKSLIRQGSGYWKFIPQNEPAKTVRFLTAYDYTVRFGIPGRLFDRLVFRPLIGWATAWSFDRLRLWIESGIDPAESMRHSLTHLVARVTVALVWIYHGLIPKLLLHHRDKLALLPALPGLSPRAMCNAIGWAELALGLTLLLAWPARWPLLATLIAMPSALLAVAIKSPGFLVAAFNPVTLNLCVFALAAIALLESRNLPSAARCIRRPAKGDA